MTRELQPRVCIVQLKFFNIGCQAARLLQAVLYAPKQTSPILEMFLAETAVENVIARELLWRPREEPNFQIWNIFRGARSKSRMRRKIAPISKIIGDYPLLK